MISVVTGGNGYFGRVLVGFEVTILTTIVGLACAAIVALADPQLAAAAGRGAGRYPVPDAVGGDERL